MTTRLEAPADLLSAAHDLVRSRTGLVFTQARHAAFEAALLGSMRRSGADDLAAYLGLLAEQPALFDELAAAVTVGETYFLRDPAQWDLLRTRLLPALLASLGGRRLRVWSAGCATGEEPYSAAIVLHQLGALAGASIIGTDLSRPALAKAGRAEYHEWALRNVPDDVEKQYFRRRGKRFELVPWLREQVEFRQLNLAEDLAPGPALGQMDLILCRNVLIYFDGSTVARVARRLIDSLADGGCLLLGASDPLISDLVPCELEVTSAGLVYRRAGPAGAPRLAAPVAPFHQLPVISAAIPNPDSAVDQFPVGRSPADSSEPDRVDEMRRRYDAKDYAGVTTLAAAAVREGERRLEVEILVVRSLANQGDLAGAGRACAAALDVHRASAELTYLHAVLLIQAGRYAQAADALRRALYLDRSMAVAHLALGDALVRLGDRVGARRAFRTVQRLLEHVPPESPVAASDGEPAARLAEAARARLLILDQAAP